MYPEYSGNYGSIMSHNNVFIQTGYQHKVRVCPNSSIYPCSSILSYPFLSYPIQTNYNIYSYLNAPAYISTVQCTRTIFVYLTVDNYQKCIYNYPPSWCPSSSFSISLLLFISIRNTLTIKHRQKPSFLSLFSKTPALTRGRIHERTFPLRFLGKILKVLRHEVSV